MRERNIVDRAAARLGGSRQGGSRPGRRSDSPQVATARSGDGEPYVVEVARVDGCWAVSVPRVPDATEFVERLDQVEACARRLIAQIRHIDPAKVEVDLRFAATAPATLTHAPAPQLSQDALDPSPY